MDKKLIAAGIVVVVAVIGAVVLFYYHQQDNVPVSNVTRPQEGYLHLKDDGESQVYLINSSISYGIYERDSYYPPFEESYVKKGDPCVIISGTIRNDGTEKWIPLGAELINAKGEKVGTVSTFSAKPWFEAIGVESNSTGTFDIRVKYNKRDVARYCIYLWWEPTASPPP